VTTTSVRSGYVMNDGNPLNYLEWGPADAAPIFFLAPVRHPAYIWRGVAERLAERHHVFAVNLRGHGDSGPFPTRAYDPDGYVDDLDAFATGLNLPPVTVIAFSVVMSGASVGFAAAHPDRVRGLVLLDGGMGYTAEQAEEASTRLGSTQAIFDDWEAALAYYADMPDQRFASDALRRERAPYVFRRLPDGTVTWKHDELFRRLWPGEDWQRNTGWQPPETWAKVRCPILVVKAASQHITVESCEEIVKYGRDSRWVEVADVTSHFVHDENPEAFLDAVRPFIEKL
jgi:pimeloyl-ACP methyl ester carboxylesterase